MLDTRQPPKVNRGIVDLSSRNMANKVDTSTVGAVSFRDNLLHPKALASVALRDRIIKFIDPSGTSTSSEVRALVDEVNALPEEMLIPLDKRIRSAIDRAVTLHWEKRLQEYVESDPPPPKYETHKGNRTPIEFLEETWGPFLDHGVLYQDRLTDYDDKIIAAIHGYWSHHGRTAGDRLPLPKRARTDAILEGLAEGSYSAKELMRAAHAFERRQHRESDKTER